DLERRVGIIAHVVETRVEVGEFFRHVLQRVTRRARRRSEDIAAAAYRGLGRKGGDPEQGCDREITERSCMKHEKLLGGLRCNAQASASGAQTERRGAAGPVSVLRRSWDSPPSCLLYDARLVAEARRTLKTAQSHF